MNPATAAAFIALAVGLLALGGVVSWQIIRGDSRADELVKERVAHQAVQIKLERAEHDLRVVKSALAVAEQRIAALAGSAEKRTDEPVNADLDPGDVDTRRVRAAVRAKAAAARRASAVPANAAEGVPTETDPAGSGASEVLAAGSLDPNESLL